jgi:hypothetical protein
MVSPREGALGVTAVVLGVVSALPWVRVGAASRSSFSLLTTVDRLGLAPSGAVRTVLHLWPFTPLLAATVLALVILGQLRTAGLAACILSLVNGALSVVVLALPLPSLIACRVAAVGSVAMLIAGLSATRRKNHGQ